MWLFPCRQTWHKKSVETLLYEDRDRSAANNSLSLNSLEVRHGTAAIPFATLCVTLTGGSARYLQDPCVFRFSFALCLLLCVSLLLLQATLSPIEVKNPLVEEGKEKEDDSPAASSAHPLEERELPRVYSPVSAPSPPPEEMPREAELRSDTAFLSSSVGGVVFTPPVRIDPDGPRGAVVMKRPKGESVVQALENYRPGRHISDRRVEIFRLQVLNNAADKTIAESLAPNSG